MNTLGFILYYVLIVYGSFFLVTGMHELSKEAKTNMPPDHIEQYYAEMSQRRMIGQLLLAIPVFSFVVWLI
jgi:hypothetical protein